MLGKNVENSEMDKRNYWMFFQWNITHYLVELSALSDSIGSVPLIVFEPLYNCKNYRNLIVMQMNFAIEM